MPASWVPPPTTDWFSSNGMSETNLKRNVAFR